MQNKYKKKSTTTTNKPNSQHTYQIESKSSKSSQSQNQNISEDSSFSSDSERRRIRFFNRQMTKSDIQNEVQSIRKTKYQRKYRQKLPKTNFFEKHESQYSNHSSTEKPKKKHKKYTDSDNSSSYNQSEEQKKQRNRFHPVKYEQHYHPRRHYRPSESSSSQDQQQQFWRQHYQINHNSMSTDYAIKILQTTLQGITIVQCYDSRNGRIIKRTLHNDLTGQRKSISNHRYQRHYKMHVINPNQSHNTSLRTNQRNENLESPNAEEQLLNRVREAIRRFTQSFNEIQTNLISQNGLTKQELQNFERRPITEPFQLQQKCSICCSEYEQGQQILTLKCIHYFHYECIQTWLLQNSLCPLCKTNQK